MACHLQQPKPALGPETMLPGLQNSLLSDQDIRAFFRAWEASDFTSRNEPLVFLRVRFDITLGNVGKILNKPKRRNW
jgi:hypothetical protein